MSRQADDPDVVWVTELWRSQPDLDACIERIRGSDAVGKVMALVDASEMIELDVGALDAIRVAPAVARAFEGGPQGLELLAFGPLKPGDGELLPEWWTT